jgi:hypothetical protein
VGGETTASESLRDNGNSGVPHKHWRQKIAKDLAILVLKGFCEQRTDYMSSRNKW